MAAKQKRKSYDDKFRASAVVMLQGQGYPENKFKLEEVAKHLGVPGRTLRRWFNGEHGQPPDDVVTEVKMELTQRLEALAQKLVDVAFDLATPEDAGLQQVVTSLGIVIDKKQLLEGKATERKELTGKNGGAIQSNITVYSDLSDEDLDSIIGGNAPFGEGREGKTEYTQ